MNVAACVFIRGLLVVLWTGTLLGWVLDRFVIESYAIDYPEDVNHVDVDQHDPEDKDTHGNPSGWDSCRNQTTWNVSDLVWKPPFSSEPSSSIVKHHGAIVVPDLLSPNTTTELLQMMQRWNTQRIKSDFFVPFSDKRKRFFLTLHDDPLVSRLLYEVASHDKFRYLLESLLGPDPALTGLFSLTSFPNSKQQTIHTDTEWALSSRQEPNVFNSSYFVAIALQKTTTTMGATLVCPGSHKCRRYKYFAGREPCQPVELEAGQALLFDTNIHHGGGPHQGIPGEPERIFLFLEFNRAPGDAWQHPSYQAHVPVRKWQMKWHMFGHGLEDMRNVYQRPWTVWDALGLSHSHGYSVWFHFFYRLASAEQGVEVGFSKDALDMNPLLRWVDVERFWQACLTVSVLVTTAWFLVPRYCGTSLDRPRRTRRTCSSLMKVLSTKKVA